MMKKSILYVVSAVLLGVALMSTPRLFLLTPEGYHFTGGVEPQKSLVKGESAYGITPHYPADEISVGLMSAFSLVLAFVVFKQYKKRTV